MNQKIRLADLDADERDFLTAEDVADVLGASAQYIRMQARDNPAALGFPVIVISQRAYFPREGFLRFCRGH